MHSDKLGAEDAIYAVLSMLPDNHKMEAIELLLPHFNQNARKYGSRIFRRMNEHTKPSSESFDYICECVSAQTGIINIPKTNSRIKEKVISRYLVMYCMVQEYVKQGMMSLQSLGNMFERCLTHSTIIHGVSQIENMYATDVELRRMLNEIADCLCEYGLTCTKEQIQTIRIL
jgi:chromosomal replication initiation ATPase DnaA